MLYYRSCCCCHNIITTRGFSPLSTTAAAAIATGTGTAAGIATGIATGTAAIATGTAAGIATGTAAGIATGTAAGIATGTAAGIATATGTGTAAGILPEGVKQLPHPTSTVYLLGSRHDSSAAANALYKIEEDNHHHPKASSSSSSSLALGLELCHGRINRMRFVNSKDIKALWQFSHTCKSSLITLHALDVSPGEAAKEVFRDISLYGIFNITYYILLRKVLSPLAERILVWRIIYGNSGGEIPLLDKWLIKWRVPLPIMRMIRGMMVNGSCKSSCSIDDIRNAIINKYPPKERVTYIRDTALDPGGYIRLCDKYNIDKRLQEVVINMRDEYMFRSLWRLASNNKRVAAVVGENHVNGIQDRWLLKLDNNNNTTARSSSSSSSSSSKFKFEEGGVFKQWLLMELLKQ